MAIHTTKGNRGGRSLAAPVRRDGETDAQFAARMVMQERDRVRSRGGPAMAALHELRDELREIVQELRAARGPVAAARVVEVMQAPPSVATTARCDGSGRIDDGDDSGNGRSRACPGCVACAPPKVSHCTCRGVCRGPVPGYVCAVQSGDPMGWQIRARSVWRALSGREPDAAEELALESNWESALRMIGREPAGPIEEGQTYHYNNDRALSWFATALAAFLKKQPNGSALQWLKQLHTQLDLSIRPWVHDELKFEELT